MSLKIIITDTAQRDLNQVIEFYTERDQALSIEFSEAFFAISDVLRLFPFSFRVRFDQKRLAPLSGFKRYWVVYKIKEDGIYLLAIANTDRHPESWKVG